MEAVFESISFDLLVIGVEKFFILHPISRSVASIGVLYFFSIYGYNVSPSYCWTDIMWNSDEIHLTLTEN